MHVQFMHALALPLAQCRVVAKELHENNWELALDENLHIVKIEHNN
jgi:hypothetical protein